MKDSQQQITEQAADWFLRLREGTPAAEDLEALTAWLLDSPVHVHEYLAIAQLYGDLAHIDPDADINIEALLPASMESSNIMLLKETVARENGEKALVTDKRTRIPNSIAAGIAVVAMLLISIVWVNQDTQQQQYVTAVGEQRSIALDDGSIIAMNTQSEITVQVDKKSRLVNLVYGEVFFDVERDPDLPFIVDTGDAQVKVLGTKFNIYKQADNTAVTVLDGKVTVSRSFGRTIDDLPTGLNSKNLNRSLELSIGEQIQIRSEEISIEKHPVNVAQVTAWQSRRLIFEAQKLGHIVNEFNRYNNNKIQVADAELLKLEISGVFESNDPDSLIEFLQRISNVRVITHKQGLRVIKAGDTSTL